jgi:hypothetical protein
LPSGADDQSPVIAAVRNLERLVSTAMAKDAPSSSSGLPPLPMRSQISIQDPPSTSTSAGDSLSASEETIGRDGAKRWIEELRRVEERAALALDHQAAQFSDERRAFAQQIAQHESTVRGLTDEVNLLKEEKAELQQQLHAAAEDQRRTVEALKNCSLQFEEMNEAQAREVTSWRTQVESLTKQVLRYRGQKEESDRRLRGAQKDFAETAEELVRANARIAALKAHAKELHARHQAKDEQLHDIALFVKKSIVPFSIDADLMRVADGSRRGTRHE